ncbi:MAG: GGDEF domain-containing protein [Sulfuricurvum sp.]|jgi:diguanylate cyclase|uniref:GGDEF domain-containing protein n=1 Tax=Sulfuricurvum sp. TaxID=2025608 RepID=UPI0025E2942C|nr:GGDEF domain-containing protein [Sulfuricurvum sp.]MCK9372934.1 GGDEF domain-containing protein [Sulfuricurvum sp.]
MSEDIEFDTITAIHDRTMAMMRALKIPPYPKHYKKYFDEIADIKDESPTSSENVKHDLVNETHCTECKYLTIANRSVMSFIETHADISHVARLQENYLKQASKNPAEQCSGLVDGLTHLSSDMSDELKRAQHKIDELTAELQKAVIETVTDPLTQVTNRKGLIQDLDSITDAGRTKQLPVVLLMIDADNFKALNDTHGHIAGDKVLYYMAHSIKSIIRSGDKVYRYGGEEFVVVLSRCEYNQAFSIADKIRAKIEHSHLIYSGKSIQMTVSIGATIHHLNDTVDAFIARADDALYRAKQEGKNKTILVE